MNEPIKRSKLRLLLGKAYYTLKTYYSWHLSRIRFANKLEKNNLPIEIFFHKTILLRKLKDVDLWMQKNKITNLKIAIKKINGLIIKPGETFSYWRQIGKPTKKKGYVEGMVLNDGQVISGTGGGLCQLSNLIFWMTLNTSLTVTERWRHGYDVFPDIKRNQPFGSGATCSYPNIDLRIKNNTKQNFQLKLDIKDGYLEGRWLSDKSIQFKYKIFEKDHRIEQEWWGGYIRSNKIFKKIFDKSNKQEVAEEFITENNAIMMYNPFLENKCKK